MIRRIAAAAAFLAGAACGGGGTEPKIGPPASLTLLSGNNQSSVAGATLSQPLVFQVKDQSGNGVPGAGVKVISTTGDGTFAPDSATTDSEGKVTFVWTLGKSAVPQTATARSGTFSAQASATVTTDYTVDVRFFGPIPNEQANAAFFQAAERVRGMVIGDLPNFNVSAEVGPGGLDLAGCGINGVVLNEIVDDLVIYATVRSIDGPGQILASAGPCYVRDAVGPACGTGIQECYGTSIIGRMVFDADDIANLVATKRLQATVLHEMLHAVGFGTLWKDKSFLIGAGTSDPRFVGPRAITGCNEAGGAAICGNGIPVENVGGQGSVDSHWRESVFNTEVMTSIAETGTVMPLSKMTIQSLADIGYSVNLLSADPYTITTSATLKAGDSHADAPFEIVLQPRFVVTRKGSIRRIVSSQ